MKYYTVRVRYSEGLEQRSFVTAEYAKSAYDAAKQLAARGFEGWAVFTVNEHDQIIIPATSILSIVVISGEEK